MNEATNRMDSHTCRSFKIVILLYGIEEERIMPRQIGNPQLDRVD